MLNKSKYIKKVSKKERKIEKKELKQEKKKLKRTKYEGFDAVEFSENIKKKKDKYYKYVKSRPIKDIKEMFKSSVELYPDKTAFMQKFDRKGKFESITYRQAYGDMNGLGTALLSLNLQGKKVAVIGANCYQWAISYLAIVCGVGTVVPLDKELDEADLIRFIDIAEIDAVIFSGKLENKFLSIRKKNKRPNIIINMDTYKHTKEAYSWWELLSEGRNMMTRGNTRYLKQNVDSEKMASLIFTSGTTGAAKAVMLSHKNLVTDLMMSSTLVKQEAEDIFFSVLPLHHTYECTGGLLMPLYHGSSIAYCEGLKYIVKNMKEVRPTIMLTVPAILEKLQKTIVKNVEKSLKGNKFRVGLKINMKAQKVGVELSDRLFGEIKESFGGRLKIIISGGAAVDPGTLRFMRSLGIIAVQGYGLTETSPMVALNPDKKMKDDSAGMILPNMEVKVDSPDEDGNGELCFKGDNIMMGYYQNTEATEEVIKDGWFYTGDLGHVDKKGFIYITGRKKNVIIAKNGKNVFPEEIEYLLKEVSYIEECMVWGDDTGKDILIVATILPDREMLEYELGNEYSEEDVKKLLWDKIDLINERLPAYKKIVKINIRKEPFIKTTTNKIKRFLEENR